MKDAIAKYIEKPLLYSTGLHLLQEVSPEHPLLPQLQKGYSTFAEKKLHIALQEFLASSNKHEFIQEDIIPKPVVFPQAVKKPFQPKMDGFPQALNELIDKRKRLFSEATYLHHQLAEGRLDQKNRLLNAKRIVNNFDEADEIWKAEDYFKEYGELPLKFQTSVSNAAEKAADDMKRINNLRTYISKKKKEISRLQKASSINKAENKIKEWEFELKQLQNAY